MINTNSKTNTTSLYTLILIVEDHNCRHGKMSGSKQAAALHLLLQFRDRTVGRGRLKKDVAAIFRTERELKLE